MSLQVNLSAVAGNDLLYRVAILYNGLPLNLTGYTPLAVLKASATATDGSGVTFGIGTGLTYTFQTSGQFTWAIPHADTVPNGTMWYRVDVDNGSTLTTALYGNLTLIPGMTMSAQWLAAYAAVGGVIVAIIARWPGRWVWRLVRRTSDFLDDYFGEPARPGVAARPGVMERLQNVEQITTEVRAETKPDAGHSLRDVVQKTAADVASVKKDVAAVKAEQVAVRKELQKRGTP